MDEEFFDCKRYFEVNYLTCDSWHAAAGGNIMEWAHRYGVDMFHSARTDGLPPSWVVHVALVGHHLSRAVSATPIAPRTFVLDARWPPDSAEGARMVRARSLGSYR